MRCFSGDCATYPLFLGWSSSLAGYLVLVDVDLCFASVCWLAGLALLAFAAVFAELWSDGRRAWGRSVAAAFAALFLLRSRCALSSTCSSCVEIGTRGRESRTSGCGRPCVLLMRRVAALCVRIWETLASRWSRNSNACPRTCECMCVCVCVCVCV